MICYEKDTYMPSMEIPSENLHFCLSDMPQIDVILYQPNKVRNRLTTTVAIYRVLIQFHGIANPSWSSNKLYKNLQPSLEQFIGSYDASKRKLYMLTLFLNTLLRYRYDVKKKLEMRKFKLFASLFCWAPDADHH